MHLQQAAVEIDGSKSGEVRTQVRPDYFSARVVGQKPFERGDIGVQSRRIRRGLEALRERHVLRDGLHVQVDGNVVFGGQIGKHQKERMVRRRRLVRRETVEMLRGHFAKPDHALPQKFFRARLEFSLDFRTGIAGGHGFHDHGVQRSAASRQREFPGMLLDLG